MNKNDLEKREQELLAQLKMALKNNEERNRQLDALHFVWCNGGCSDGVHRYNNKNPLTEELVAEAERNTRRMRRWLINYEFGKLPYKEKLKRLDKYKRQIHYRLWRWIGRKMNWTLYK